MAQIIRSVPIFVMMIGLMAFAMFVPAIHAWWISDYVVGRSFLYSGLLLLVLSGMLGLASMGGPDGVEARGKLLLMVATYTVLPLICAIPFDLSVQDTSLLSSWWEMVSSMTTTGATLYDPVRLPTSVHLWRAMVGWFGGFFMLIMAIAVLAPLRLGGFEIFGAREAGAFARMGLPDGDFSDAPYVPNDASVSTDEKVWHFFWVLLPAYAGLTGLLWILMMMTGVDPLIAACHAMSTISTSGISPVGGLSAAGSSMVTEMLIFVFLLPALSRRFWPGGGELRASKRLIDDPELRLAAFLVFAVTATLFVRHWIAAFDIVGSADILVVAKSIWGAMFTALSFLTTTGFESSAWNDARAWSGLGTPGLFLAGLAMIGGGVATTAGGVRLLRIYALIRQNERELHKLVHPDSVAGGGATSRWLRREGAYVAWIFFVLFAMTLTIIVLLLTFVGTEFEPATIMSIAALSNTGQLAAIAGDHPLVWANLGTPEKIILALTMVLGRIETLAIVALVNPELWRS